MQILANYNYRQNPNFRSLKLINERPYSKFPSNIAERISKSHKIKGLAASLHKSGIDLAVVCTPMADILVMDSRGKKYPEFNDDIQIMTPQEEVPAAPNGIFDTFLGARWHVFEALISNRLARQHDEILDKACRDIDEFNESLKN